MQSNTKMRYYFTPSRMAIFKKQVIASVGENVEKLESSYIAGKNIKLCSLC